MRNALLLSLCLAVLCAPAEADRLKAMILDGQNNHDWRATTPIMKGHLEDSGRFVVDVVTSPPPGESQRNFNPAFAEYDVVVLNYNGNLWNRKVQQDFVDYVAGGGGLVVVHAANNPFARWTEYNKIIGFGGWGGRTKASGPYIYMENGELVRDYESDGPAGAHEGYARIVIDTVMPEHPIMEGLPASWYTYDELYNLMRGPGENMTVLATAYSSRPRSEGGSGRHEPMIFTVTYGEGSVFHTTLGHDVRSMRGAGFAITLVRGAEWAATGEVTVPLTEEIPRPLAPHEALGEMRTRDSYHPVHTILAELAGLSEQPAERAKVEAALIGYLEDPDTRFQVRQAASNALGLIGSTAAVPALEGLLNENAEHASIALLGLDSIPGPEATAALVRALEADNDFNRIGIINSLGRRGDAGTVAALATAAAHTDTAVARAAMNALGKMRTPEAVAALEVLPQSTEQTTALLAAAHGLIESDHAAAAHEVFREVAAREGLSTNNRTAALRGLFALDAQAAMAHVWALLEGDTDTQAALNVLASAPPGAALTRDILARIDALTPETQVALVALLGAMGDATARPRILSFAQSAASPAMRETAIVALGALPGHAATMDYLCSVAVDRDSDFRGIARDALQRAPGIEAEEAIIEGIRSASEAQREAYMLVAEARNLTRACAVLLEVAADADSSLQRDAFNTLRQLAGPEEYDDLVRLAANAPEPVRGSALRAAQYAGRSVEDMDQRLSVVVETLEQGTDETAIALMPLLPDISSDAALAVAEAYARTGAPAVQEAAIEALSDWQNAAALEAVLTLAQTAEAPERRALLMGAFGDLIADTADVPIEQTMDYARSALRIGLDLDGKRALLRALAKLEDARALPFIDELGQDPTLAEDANRAALAIKRDMMGEPLLSASHGADALPAALDGDAGTRWSTGASMAPGMWFGIDLRMQSQVYSLVLDTTQSADDYPRGYAVYVADEEIDTDTMEPVLTGEGNGAITTMTFDPPQEGRFIRIVQTGSHGLFWSIHELSVLHDPGFESVAVPATPVEELLAGRGFVEQWNITGPFARDGAEGDVLFDMDFGPETDTTLAFWLPLDEYAIANGIIDFEKVYSSGDHRASYLMANIVADDAQEVFLGIGSDDSVKVWHNGELLLAHESVRPVVVDNNIVPLQLKAGDNMIMMKVVDLTGDWGGCARIFAEKEEEKKGA